MTHDRIPSDPTAAAERQRVIEDLFDLVRALPEEQRDSAIDAGSQDSSVRSEVRSLLRFDGPTVPTVGAEGQRAFDPQECIGLTAAGFTLRSVIGAGGMGTVFEAEQELPARSIAVKVLHGASMRASALARFRKESEFLARLDHPNIARVISAGSLALPGDGGARPFIAMELVEGGRSITRWAREERADRRAVVAMLATACDAVGSGHRAGVAHLDLKPANLLVSRTGALRVIDYGIARSLDDSAADGDGPFVGTPQYMSPEQCTRGAKVDSRADVYALGLILYEMLAGRMPYDTRGEPFAAITRLVRESEPPALRLVDSTVPRDLDAIVCKAIAKAPDARYGTASELADDLRRWLAHEPVVAAAPRASEAALRFVRRNPLIAVLFSVALAAIVAVAVVSVVLLLEIARSSEIERVSAARANLQAACSAVALGEHAETMMHMSRVPDDLRGWVSRHLSNRIANFELYGAADSEVLSIASLDATREVVAGVTGGFVEIASRDRSGVPVTYDLRPFYANASIASVYSVAGSADGRTIFAATSDFELLAIDRQDEEIRRLAAGVLRLQPSGRFVACALTSGALALVDARTGEIAASTPSASAPLRDASIAKNGRSALLALDDGALRMVEIDPDAATVRDRWTTQPDPARTRAPAVSPDGSTVLVAWKDGRLTRHDPQTGAVLAETDLPGGSVYMLTISPDNRTAAASSWANNIRLVDTGSLEMTRRLSGTLTHIWGIDFSADGSRIFGRIVPATSDGRLQTQSVDCIGGWLVERERAIDDLEIGRSLIAATSGPRSGDFTAVAVDGTLVGHDARARTVAELGTAPRGTTSIARSTEWLALGSSDGFVELQRISDGHAASAWRTRALDLSITALAASPDGRTVVAGDSDHSIAALDARDGSIVWRREIPLQEPNPKRRRVLKPFFLDGGRAVTFAGMLAGTRRWAFDLASGEVRADLSTGLTFETEDCVFRKTDGRIYGLGITGYITTSRGTEPDELGPFALNGGVMCLNQAHDRLFAATRDGSMRVAGFDPLLEIGRFAAPPGNPLAISFDDETDSLTVLTNRGVARTWLGRPDPRKDRLLTVPFAGAKRIPRLKDAAGTK